MLTACLCAYWPTDAYGAIQTDASGNVRAALAYNETSPYRHVKDLGLAIVRDGQRVYDQAVTAVGCVEPTCLPARSGRAVSVRDLDGDGEPEVVVDLFWGGTHCCHIAKIFAFDGTGYRLALERNWGDPHYDLTDLNGDTVPELVGRDGRFSGDFTGHAGTGWPVMIWRYAGGRLHDVTREFPEKMEADGDYWLKQYFRTRRTSPSTGDGGLGLLAAWAGNEYRLGRRADTLRTLRQLLRVGGLEAGPLWLQGRRFIVKLDRLLRAWGYH